MSENEEQPRTLVITYCPGCGKELIAAAGAPAPTCTTCVEQQTSQAPRTWVVTDCSVCNLEMMAGSWEKPPVCMDCAAKLREAADLGD